MTPQGDIYERLATALEALPHGFARTPSGVEIKLMKKAFTPEEVWLAGQLTRIPETAAEIAKRVGREVVEVTALLESLIPRGLVALPGSTAGGGVLKEEMKGEKKYRLRPFMVGWYEAGMRRLDKEFAELFEQFIIEGGGERVFAPRPTRRSTTCTRPVRLAPRASRRSDDDRHPPAHRDGDREDARPRRGRDRVDDLQQPRSPQRHVVRHADCGPAYPRRLRRRSRGARRRRARRGERAFVSGADISEFSEKRTTVAARANYDDALAAAWASWRTVDKPIIAMIRGYCIGGGLMTAMKADIRVAADGSEFAIPAAKLGLGYAYGGVEELMALVGPSWASEILFSARRLGADEALRIGLVNRVVPVDELEPAVRALAATIAANAPLTVQACKAAIREARRDPSVRDLEAVERMVEACFRSDDYLEGQAAFAEKRPPRFRGR